MNVRERVIEAISNKAGKPVEADDWLVSLMDSLSRYELVYELEDAFDVHIPDEVGSNLESVGELVDFVVAATGQSS